MKTMRFRLICVFIITLVHQNCAFKQDNKLVAKIFKELSFRYDNFVISPLGVQYLLDFIVKSNNTNYDIIKNIKKEYFLEFINEIYTDKKLNITVDSPDIAVIYEKGADKIVLSDSTHFKANWSRRFDATFTKKSKFYKTNGDILNTSTMHKNDFYRYFKSRELHAKFIEIPFGSQRQEAALVIILPSELNTTIFYDNSDQLFDLKPDFTTQYVNLALPKFKIKKNRISLKSVLNDLGITQFRGFPIGDLVQSSSIEIDEKGAEGSEFVYLISPATNFAKIPREPHDFIVDKPFAFYVKIQDFIVIMGKISTPN